MKTIVYTCITNGKNSLLDWQAEDDIQYICFHDGTVENTSKLWDMQSVTYKNDDPRRIARYYKTHPHEVLPKHDISIWIDGSLYPRVHLQQLVDWIGNYDYACRHHPGRICIYKEAEAIIRMGFDTKENIQKVVDKLEAEGYPSEFGLHETGVLVRQHKQTVIDFDTKWWEEIENGSSRDQMSFDYVRWYQMKGIMQIPKQWFSQVAHRHMR